MFSPPVSPIPPDDDLLRQSLVDAEFPALLAAVAHVTGDQSVLRPELRPERPRLREPNAGLSPEQLSAARDVCFEALRRFRDERACRVERPSDENLAAIMSFIVGEPVGDRYLPLLREELSIDGDLRAPQWNKSSVAPDRDFLVAIVGAGMSGIAAAHRLQQAGVPFVIFEKNPDVGGTWFENSYPGCRVDIQNHQYSYSFAQKHDWPFYFSPRNVLHEYFRQCAESFGLMPHISFGTEVLSCTWDEPSARWMLRVRTEHGESTIEANALVSAVGQLNRPKLPDIAGLDDFAGESFHSAEWRHDIALDGKRVAVIGTGASACQFIPEIAPSAGHLDIFQRTAPWLIPSERYREPVAEGFQWLLQHVPFYAEWYRFFLFYRGGEGLIASATVDPSYPPTERAVSAANEEIRSMLMMWLEFCAAGDDELLQKITPDYPPLSKRFVVDNGMWAQTLKRPNVSLTTMSIERVEAGGVRTADGVLHEADVIIYGTGFQASRFLTPMKVVGRDGADLHEQWHGDARAYLGIVVPNFPNFFCLYGPNTNIVVNGSIIYFSECEVNYVVECMRLMLTDGLSSLDPRQDVHDAYNERIDAANRLRTWGFSKVSSWYKNDVGRVAQNWPFNVLEYWEQTRTPNPADYSIR
jgi:4-hydroxyacetophenone monooxygenase